MREKAVEYSNKLWFYQDSVGKTDRNKALIEMQEKYDQQKIINENNLSQIKMKVSKGRRWMPWLSEATKDVISCEKLGGGANSP